MIHMHVAACIMQLMHQLPFFTTTVVEIVVELANQVLNSTFSQHNLEKPSFFPVIFSVSKTTSGFCGVS